MVFQFLLYNKVNQLYVYIYPHIPSLSRVPPTLPIPPRQVVTKHRADLPLCYGAASHQLSILHLVVYICPCHSLTLSQLTLPPPCVLKSILYGLRLYSCPAPRFFRTIFFFLDSIYMCQHTVFVFLFLTYFTLYDSLYVQPPHYKQLSFVSSYG